MSVEIHERPVANKKIAKAKLYCVTSQPREGQTYEETVESACRGGADVVQLRDKTISSGDMVSLGRRLGAICRRHDALFIVNDRTDVALASGADGVHLGQDDLPVREARGIANAYFWRYESRKPSAFLVGCSTHSLDQALKAQEAGADYLGCGPIFSTPTKPDVPALGLDLVRQYREKIRVPFIAIGGIDESNIKQVLEAGASSVAVVRAVFGSPSIEESARSLRQKIGRGE